MNKDEKQTYVLRLIEHLIGLINKEKMELSDFFIILETIMCLL